jgi:hypothetical protein
MLANSLTTLTNSLMGTFAALFFPSRSTHITVGKLALISLLFTIFFLFTAGYHFPGGARIFTDWADAIIQGTTLPPGHAQRDVGFPLLFILGGFPFNHSFIGITLIQALFAILMPVLVYLSIVRASASIAFYMGLVCIISLAPFTYMKFFYHDQAYMVFNLLSIVLLVEFLWCSRFIYLILFTLAVLAASFTRTAGNLLYPAFLAIAYFTVRGPLRYYLASIMIFVAVLAVYQWHRYEIFDARHQPSIPSGKGMQISYAAYLYMGDFGYRLSPDMGPKTKLMLEKLRQGLQPTTRESPLIKNAMNDVPEEFMEKHIYSYTPEELYELICTKPNEEYYWILYAAFDPDDQFHFDVAMETWRSYPWYVVQYTMRNLWHALFDPGYSTPRYTTVGYGPMGNEFQPATQGWGVRSEDPVTQYGERAAREMEYFPLEDRSPRVQRFFGGVHTLWAENYHAYVWVTAVPIFIAWIGAFLGVVCWIIPDTKLGRVLTRSGVNKLIGPIFAVSALLLYEDLATSMFSQPHYRYFHITEPWRLVVGGYGIAFVIGLLSAVLPARKFSAEANAVSAKQIDFVSSIQRWDLVERWFGPRRALWVTVLVAINGGMLAWWTSSMMAHTWYPPSPNIITVVEATYGAVCKDFVPKAPITNGVKPGNATAAVSSVCKRKDGACRFTVDPKLVGDPASGCGKDFEVKWRCGLDDTVNVATIAAEAVLQSVDLQCPPKKGVN